jgi:predicted nucleic acid-binding protein
VLALLNPSDENHGPSRRVFEKVQAREAPLLTTSFVLVEVYALLGPRMGLAAVEAFRKDRRFVVVRGLGMDPSEVVLADGALQAR